MQFLCHISVSFFCSYRFFKCNVVEWVVLLQIDRHRQGDIILYRVYALMKYENAILLPNLLSDGFVFPNV